MLKKKASELQPGDLIHYPAGSSEWLFVLNVGVDTRRDTYGNVYVAIEEVGNRSFDPDDVIETKD